MTKKAIIEKLNLKPLPMEGGYYRETYRSEENADAHCLPDRYQSQKSVCTAIYYLITPDLFSNLHQLPTDEIYHFYAGDPINMLQLHPDDNDDALTIGNNLSDGEIPQVVAPI